MSDQDRRAPTSGGDLPRRAWTPREAAQQLGIPYETVLRLIHEDQLLAVTAGRYYLIPDAAIDSFLNPRG